MADFSPAIANEFIRRGAAEGVHFTQMQLQKLVYIANGWNLAINGKPLTTDSPEAWDYGPVYRELRQALRHYGRSEIKTDIIAADTIAGVFDDEPQEPLTAHVSDKEAAVIDRVYKDYSGFHAFQLSALTHQPGTPWTRVYANGAGKGRAIPSDDIRDHFVGLATGRHTGA